MTDVEALAKALYESGVADNTGRYSDYYPDTEWGELTANAADAWIDDAEKLYSRLRLAGYRVAPKTDEP
jgi:hypothetical protein